MSAIVTFILERLKEMLVPKSLEDAENKAELGEYVWMLVYGFQFWRPPRRFGPPLTLQLLHREEWNFGAPSKFALLHKEEWTYANIPPMSLKLFERWSN